MGWFRRLGAMVVLVSLIATPVAAVTIRDIVDLARAGMSDEVILALIEADGTVFTLGSKDLVELKEAGVSQTVLVAMLRSGRSAPRSSLEPREPAEPAFDDPAATVGPAVVIIGRSPEPVAAAVPVYIPVPIFGTSPALPFHRAGRAESVLDRPGFGRFINDGWYEPRINHRAPGPARPVYWGWDGKLRPDAWGQPQKK
jgi:hypothetical protein